MKMDELTEATLAREDSIWLNPNLTGGVSLVIDWEEVKKLNGDFDEVEDLIVYGIPLYGDAETAKENATRYLFNQQEIRNKTKENEKLLGHWKV